MSSEMERCVGCEAKSRRHPIVAVARRGDVQGDRVGEEGEFAAHPVCDACWRDPAHRRQPIKAHFFPRGQERGALASAGSDSIG